MTDSLNKLKKHDHRFSVIESKLEGYKETITNLVSIEKLNNVKADNVNGKILINIFDRLITVNFINNIDFGTVEFLIEKTNEERNEVYFEMIVKLEMVAEFESDSLGDLKHAETGRIETIKILFWEVINEIVTKQIKKPIKQL